MQVDNEEWWPGPKLYLAEKESIWRGVSIADQQVARHLCQDGEAVELVQVGKITLGLDS